MIWIWIDPKEFSSHARPGRTSLSDTALTTSEAGYSQRKLIKLMEKMVVHNDGSVRFVYSTKRYGDVKKDIDTINNSDIYDTYKDF